MRFADVNFPHTKRIQDARYLAIYVIFVTRIMCTTHQLTCRYACSFSNGFLSELLKVGMCRIAQSAPPQKQPHVRRFSGPLTRNIYLAVIGGAAEISI